MEKLTTKEQLVLQKVKEYLANGEKITIRGLQVALGYASPRSISVLLDQIMEKGWLYRDSRDELQLSPNFTSDSYEVRGIPLIGTVACGMPIFAEENIETEIPVSTKIVNRTDKYFFLRAQGDSMNQKEIDDGDLVLIRQTNIARNGDIIIALINDEATLKEFRQEKGSTYLIPHSDNPRHKPIILDESDGNIMIQGVFVRAFPGGLFN
ncbi:MAG: transcriptional repressor LexA [Candidatus Gracilibacteria bacterium]|nr:transcriptional repressor LexA [Candidatus Gracilibacteria bacterium]